MLHMPSFHLHKIMIHDFSWTCSTHISCHRPALKLDTSRLIAKRQSVELLVALYGFVVIYRHCLMLDVIGSRLTAAEGVGSRLTATEGVGSRLTAAEGVGRLSKGNSRA
jgi:hypothetical protein